MTERLRAMGEIAAGSERPLELRQLDQAARVLLKNFDSIHGGFGSAPKFPHPMDLRVLLRQVARTGDDAGLARGQAHARQDGPWRHLRPSRRRVRSLLHRRALAGAALREDALRQCPAVLGLPRGVPGDRRGPLRPGGPRDARLRPAPDDRAKRGASTRPRTPTARARKGSTTSGRWPRSTRSSAPDAARHSATSTT